MERPKPQVLFLHSIIVQKQHITSVRHTVTLGDMFLYYREHCMTDAASEFEHFQLILEKVKWNASQSYYL